MNEQIPKKEKNNTTYKIIGRSSNDEIKKRRDICTDVHKAHPNLSKNRLIDQIKVELIRQNIKIPTDQTLNSDLLECGINYKNLKSIYSGHTDFKKLGVEIHTKLRQIRVGYNTRNIILFDYEKDSTRDYNPFEESGLRYEDIVDFLPKLSKSDLSQISPNTLLHLSIILKEKGLGEYIANIFDSNSVSPKPFLYSEIHDYCTIIVFEYKNYGIIMDSAYEIVKNFICSPLHKPHKTTK